MNEEQLIAAAREAALKAYAPYSRFSVGCAVEVVDGEMVTGANMENACYRLGLCAEQSALTAAQHGFGLDKVARIAVAGGDGSAGNLPATLSALPAAAAARRSSRRPALSGRDIEILCANGGDVHAQISSRHLAFVRNSIPDTVSDRPDPPPPLTPPLQVWKQMAGCRETRHLRPVHSLPTNSPPPHPHPHPPPNHPTPPHAAKATYRRIPWHGYFSLISRSRSWR